MKNKSEINIKMIIKRKNKVHGGWD